jgi:hypothetical protein
MIGSVWLIDLLIQRRDAAFRILAYNTPNKWCKIFCFLVKRGWIAVGVFDVSRSEDQLHQF